MAENRFLQSPYAQPRTDATAPVAPAIPEFKALPARSAAASLSQGLLPPPDLQPLFEKYSAQYDVPLNVLSAMAQQESSYDANAIGEMTKWGQAKGLMQNLDSTAKGLGIDPFDPEQSIAGAARQLRERLDKGSSMEDAVKAHFGGDNRKQWGEKTQAYGQEVLAKASIIGDELLAGKKKAAPTEQSGYDLAAIQAELDAKEPGRYKVIDPAAIAERDQQRADIASGKNALGNALDATRQSAPSPLTMANQQAIQQPEAPSPYTTTNQSLVEAGKAPIDTRPYQGFIEASGAALSNVPERFQQSIAGLIQMQGESLGEERQRFIADRARQYGITPGDMQLLAWAGEQKLIDPATPAPQALELVKATIATQLDKAQLKQLADAGLVNPQEITDYGTKWRADTKKTMAEVRPEPDSAAYFGSAAIGSFAEMAPMLAAAIITRNPTIAAGVMSGQVGGQSYAEGREQGLSPDQAQVYTVLSTAAEVAPEALVVGHLLKGGSGIMKKALQGTILEGAQESVTSALQAGIDQQMVKPDMTLKEALLRVRDGAVIGSLTGGAMGGTIGAAESLGRRQPTAEPAPRIDPGLGDMADEPAPTAEAPQTQAPAPESVAETPAPAPAAQVATPSGPLTRAAQQYVAPAPAAPAPAGSGEPVTVRSSDGEMLGTLENYQDHGNGLWSARILADDGNAYDFTQDDGVQLERASAPTPAATETAQPAQLMPTLTDIVEPEAAPAPDYAAMDVPQLRAELKATATAIKADPKNKALLKQRSAIGKAIDAQKSTEPATEEASKAPADRTDGTTGAVPDTGMTIVHGSGNPGMRADDIQIVRATGQKQGKKGSVYGGFYGTSEADSAQAEGYAGMMGGTSTLYDVKIKPGTKVLNKTGDITRLSEKYINELTEQGYGLVVGTDPRGRTEYVVIDKAAIDAVAARPSVKAQAVAELTGKPIDKEWSRFADDSGSLNIPRADMPQIKAEHRGAMVNFLNARGIAHTQEEVPASSLKPTQEEFSPAKVKKALGFEGGDRSILISSDNHVLDGHHQWLAKVDGDQPVKVIRLDAPIKQLLDDVREFPSATTADGATAAPKNEPTNSLSRTASWAIRDKATGDVVMETFDQKKVDALNTEKYEAVPIQQHLAEVNASIKAGDETGKIKPAAETKPAEPASEVPKTATPAAETASKPLSPQQKAKARKEGRQAKVRDLTGLNVDDQFTVSADVGYASPGTVYTLDEIDGQGTAHITSATGGTTLSMADLLRAKHDGVSFAKVDPETPAMEAPALPTETAAELAKSAEYGASNKLVSQDRAAELRARLKAKLNGSQLNSGIDPEILALGTELAVFHIEAGVRKFADFAKTMADDLGQPLEKVRPYLRSWFNGARDMMEDAGHSVEGMDDADTVRAELAKLGKPAPEPTALQQWQGRMEANGAKRIEHDGEQWFFYPGSAGVVREDGKQFTHLSSVDQGRQQKNGWNPKQASDYVNRDGKATVAENAMVQPPSDNLETVSTPAGTEFQVRHKVVEENSLITSNFVDGPVNPAYPKALQPRDRSRSASLDQINDIAKNLNPRLLGGSPSATDGAPIVSPEGVVESGNGRTLAIRQAYALDNESAVKYRDWLQAQGYDVADMASPILVRERVTPMTTEQLVAYTTEANERTTLALSSTERAVADGKRIGELLHLYHGGDVAGAANREFVRAFIGDVASKSDRGSLMDGDGLLSQDGRRRIEAALLAAAYDDPALVGDIFESADSDIKAIGGALLDAAGPWAQMRQESRDGQISSKVDVTPNLMEAVNMVRRARATGKSVFELVNQNDIFSGELDQATKDWVGVFYRGANLARARGRDKVADALLTYTQLARATQPGNNLFGEPELTGADLLRGTHDKLDRQEAQANQQQGLFGNPQPDDASPGARGADGQRPAPGARSETPQQGEQVNAAGTGERVEPDRADTASAKSVDAGAVPDEPSGPGRGTGEPGASPEPGRADGQRDQRLPTDGAAAGRESGDQRVHQPDGAFRPTLGAAGGAERTRSGGDSVTGEPVERERAERIIDAAPAADASEFGQRLAAQKKATGTKTVRGDKANIDAALPLLLDPQRDDVLKTEQRFAVGNGMLLTNGTGTGKTASGMGVIVRSINDGKPNALVVVPSDKIAADWIKFAKMLGVDLKLLDSIRDNGKDGQVITTYANFGANDSLALRDWDQFVMDEAHYLSSNEAGEGTAALARLQALSGHHDGFYQWVRQRHADVWQPYKAAMQAVKDAQADTGITEESTAMQTLRAAEDKAREQWKAIEEPAKQVWQARWASQQDLPKTLFLSATPFAYVKSVDYAEGYLFDYVAPADRFSNKTEMQGSAYNSGDTRERFFMQHFGYRMRYNKLTAPEAGVDAELMEQNFNQHLKDIGALSGRRLEVPHDYDRKFVVVDDAVGQKIDQGLAYLREHADGKYRKVYDAVMGTFDYQKRMYLLESIKARAAVPMIKAHMALGRKVVVFHDYNKGGGFDPFNAGLASITDADVKSLAREAFAARPDIFKKMDLKGLFSPIDTLSAAFPDALFFNGTVPQAKRRANADTFNDDTSGKDLIVLQSDAGREGVSLHDTSGQHMRVLINLGMPGKPVAAIQIEGRTYRTGQASDAAFRYLTTGTAWEASAFASKIAERASTAENLALGTEARGLKQSFIDAYNGAEDLAPGADDGKGGKALDRELGAASALSPFQKAKAYYFAQQKNTKRRDQREGTDYFATPEPVGFKMAEWANIQKGDDVLEPSAGHGAIARFFPPQSNVTMVEPSYDLSQRAALANGTARIINDNFEALHLTNKYDAIVMNPPYGNGGKTAIEHVAKAAKHLREGGRIVALIPRGGLTDKRLAAFLESDEAQSLHRVATFDMPSATFERAGTAVNTQILVLEKHSNPGDAQNIHARTINLSNAESTAELFDRIEHLDLPERAPTSKPEPKVELIEHITGRGKRLTGIVRTDLTRAEAEEIDGATFRKNGGWFIRSKYLGDGNRLSVAAPIGEPASHEEVRDAITQGPFGNVVKKLIDTGNIVIHGNVQSLPDGVEPVRGMQAVTTPDGKVHLIAANLSPETANGVLLHEMFHSGGEQLVGSKRWADLMKRLDGLHRQAEQTTGKAREVFDRARQRVQEAQEQGAVADDMTAEEFGAYAIEEYEQLPKAFRKWVDDLVGAIKHWLFSRYGKQLGQVTPAQLRAMAKDALVSMALAKRGELFGPAGTMFSVKPSKVFTDLTDKQKSFLDKIGPEKLPQRLADRWRQLTDNLGLRIRQAGVDRYAPLLRNDQALHGADTLEGSIADSSWVLARMSKAAGGAVNALLNSGRLYLDADQKVIDLIDNSQGLGATLRKLGNPAEIDRFMGWIAANRSKRLLGEGRENLFTPEEIEDGIKLSAGKLLDGKPRGILYQQAWKEFQQHRDDVLGIAEQTGIITPEQRATWSDEFYVPFYRVIDSDSLGGPKAGSGLSRQQAYKKLKGGKQHLNDLLENTLLNFHHLLQASLKNQAANMAMANAEQLGIADKTTEARRDKKASTFVMEGGEKQWYNISDPLTFKAVSALTDTGMNTIAMQVMRGFKRFFTNMTTITPQFVVANAIRDTLSAMATSPTSAIPLKTAFKGALTYGNNHQRARMMASGGAFSFGHVYGQGAHEMKVALTGSMRSAQVLRDPKLIPNTLLTAWRKYHNVTDFAENMNRAGIWEQNLHKGKLKAAFEARDLMDFSAHGDAAAIRFFIDVVPFLNARIQGLDKLYRSGIKPTLKTMFGKGSKSDKQAFARFAAVIGALTAFSVMLYLRNKDDEDYRKLEDWQRDTYWVLKIGESMFFIPKPFEVGSIATMGERLMEQFVDPTVGGDKLAERARHMLMDTFAMNPTPQAFKPLLELGYNENTFTGRPIEDQSMSRLSPSLRARPDTTRLSEASSRGLEAMLGNAALSPVQIDHLIQGYLGAVGSTAVGMADTFWRRAQGEELPARSWDEYQPVKRFYKDLTKEANYTRYGTDFYTALKKSDQAYADLQHLAKYGEEEKAVALEQDKADVLALRGTLVKVNRSMSRINAEMKRVQMDKDMDGATKRLELDRLRSMRNLMTEEIGKELEQEKMAKRASERR